MSKEISLRLDVFEERAPFGGRAAAFGKSTLQPVPDAA
jgi:hypothetical protein